MKFSKSIAMFALGAVTAGLVMYTAVPALAASTLQTLQVVYGGIDVFVDGKLQVATDVNGNVVEPILYDGTTYLPLRATVGMLTDMDVTWDGDTQSIYIGTVPDTQGVTASMAETHPTDYKGNKAFYYADYNAYASNHTIVSETITTFNEYINGSYTFDMGSQYQYIEGYFVIPYTALGSSNKSTLTFYSVDQYGTETKLASYSAVAGDDPIEVKVNVIGCNYVKIKYSSSSSDGCFYNVTTTTLS